MRIALRTSGGRGEYEISGSHSTLKAFDVIDHKINLEILPGTEIPTSNIIRRKNGKPRIRVGKSRHIYLILSDILLLPKPKRELYATPPGKLQLTSNNYSVISIPFGVTRIDSQLVVINPTDLILANSDNDPSRIDIIERLRLLLTAWDADYSDSELKSLVVKHKQAVYSRSDENILDATKALREFLSIDDDPLKAILTASISQTDGNSEYWMGLHTIDAEEFQNDIDLSDFREAALNRIKKWRQYTERGSDAIKFSEKVKAAYNCTCLFTGHYLPKTLFTNSAGVDSAHILPWASHNLNSVCNGICLSKLCHWAFDAGILRLEVTENPWKYILTIPSKFLRAEQEHLIDLSAFKPLLGEIDSSRLPKETNDWPHPRFLKEYNRIMDQQS